MSDIIGLHLNNYEIVSVLGQGGMGTVYLARHTFTGRKAAVKLLHPEFARDPVLVSRLMNEARATAAIGHPNIIDIIDVGQLPDGNIPYLMMEFLPGESLAGRLHRSRPLPIPEAIEIACQTASALSAAHACEIIHRDLKPDNLFLVPDASILPLQQRVKVLDFGIAKLQGDLTGGSVKTRTGTIMGTPQYMSPEQCRGVVQDIDHRTDIYTLGIIVYEMVCGAPPFVSEGVGEMLVMHLTSPPAPPRTLNPDITENLEAAILCALAKDPNERFASMEAFQAALRAWDGEPAVSEAVGQFGRPSRVGSSGVTPPPVAFAFPKTAALRAPTQMPKPPTLAAAPTGDPSATPAPRTPGTTLSSSAGQVFADRTTPARQLQPLVRWAALAGGVLVLAVAVYLTLISKSKPSPGPSVPTAAAPAPVVAPVIPPPVPPVPTAAPPQVVAPPAARPAPAAVADDVPAVNPKNKARGKKRGTRGIGPAAPDTLRPTPAPAPSPASKAPAAEPAERW
jgi:eukaryotic-like serine/threonine-protein kinase